jgi:signal transduction histidine kinase
MRRRIQLFVAAIGFGVAMSPRVAWSADSDPVNPRYTGTPFMRTWLAEDYGASPSTRGVMQDPRTGFMYFANAGGLLEYDGVRWRLHAIPGGGGVSTFAIDALGRVRFSTDNEVGYLAPDAVGDHRAVSVLAQLPADEPTIFPLGACVAMPDGIYYTARDRLVRFSLDEHGRAQTWKFPGGELAAPLWVMNDALHVRGPSGVFRFDGSGFRAVDGLRTAAFITRPDSAGGWQMVNRDGVRRWDGGYKPVGPGLPPVVSPLAGDVALGAAYLPDGRIAFGTTRSGIIVADRYGRRLQVIDRSRGLLSDRVEGICVDREGGLWATFRNGIMRLQLESPYARHGAGVNRIDGTPTALALHRGELFVGGGEGLWRRDRDGAFHAVGDVAQYVRSLVSLDGQLYVTGVDFRRVLGDDRSELIGSTYHGLVAVSTAPGVVVHGTNNGLAFDRVAGSTWTSAGRIDKISGPMTALCEYPAGVIWAANHTTGLWRVDFREGVRADAPVKNYRAAQGVPPALNQYNGELFAWDGGLGGALAGRFLRYEEATDRFVPEKRIEDLPTDAAGVANVWILGSRPGSDGSLWLQPRTPDAPILRVVPIGPHRWRAERPPGPALTHYFGTGIRHDEALHTLWLAGNGLLLSRDLDWRSSLAATPPAVAIRRIEQADGKLIWADRSATRTLQLAPHQNRLRVLFAAPIYAGDHLGRTHTRFRTRLEGLDDDWTPWSNEAQRDFTNLPYRDFVFHVQARDDEGRESAEVTLGFVIAPPWWLARGMFAGYALVGLTGVAALVHWRTQTLRRRAAHLETIVASRTEELRQSNAELARLHAIERDEKLAARLNEEKARLEMLRYQLNPHFLYNTLASICGTARTNPEATRTMAQRLADFCRLTLTRADETETVREELRMLQSYLDIEKARWRDQLQIEIDVADAALDHRLPTFLLLPLLENAIKHGGQTTRGVLHLRLAIHAEGNGGLVIEVANTGTWDTTTPKANSTGIGLENLRRRLARHFPGAHTFTIGAEGERVVARLRIADSGLRIASDQPSDSAEFGIPKSAIRNPK